MLTTRDEIQSLMKIVVSYRGVPRAPGWEAGACLARALRSLGHEVYEFGHYHRQPGRRLNEAPAPREPDLWIYVECGDEDPPYGEVLASGARVKVYWDFDTAIHRGGSLQFIRKVKFDHVFLGNGRELELIRSIHPSVHFLPYAVAADRLACLQDVPKTVDAGMVGQATRKRMQLVAALERAGVSATILQGKYGRDLITTINSFRICLNYEVTGGKGLLNSRVWEVLGCGGFLLNEVGNGIESLFVDGRHLVLFSSQAECVDKAMYYLAHPDEACEIARAGHQWVLENHTYQNRAETMLSIVRNPCPPGSSPSAMTRLKASILLSVTRGVQLFR